MVTIFSKYNLFCSRSAFELFDQQAKVFKFKKTLDYTELPNEADKGVEKLKVAHEMVKGELKDMVNEVNKIKNKFEKFLCNLKKLQYLLLLDLLVMLL